MLKPIGNTLLIITERNTGTPELINGLYIPTDSDSIKSIHYTGTIKEHGTLVDDETKKILPIGTKVIFDWKSKTGTKLELCRQLVYIKDVNDILAIMEEEA
jgi:hypothetical protein